MLDIGRPEYATAELYLNTEQKAFFKSIVIMSYIVISYPWVIDIWLETMQKYLQHCCPVAQRADDIDSSQSNDHCRCLGFVLTFGTLKYLKSAD